MRASSSSKENQNSRLLADEALVAVSFEALKKLDEDSAKAIHTTLQSIPTTSSDVRAKVEKLSSAHVAATVTYTSLLNRYYNFPSSFDGIVSVEPVQGITAEVLKEGLLEDVDLNLSTVNNAKEERQEIHKKMTDLLSEIHDAVSKEAEAVRKSEAELQKLSEEKEKESEVEEKESSPLDGAISSVSQVASILLGPEGIAMEKVFEVAKSIGLQVFNNRNELKKSLAAISETKARQLLAKIKRDSQDLKQVVTDLEDVSQLLNTTTEVFQSAVAFWKAIRIRVENLTDQDLRLEYATLEKSWRKFFAKKPTLPQLATLKKVHYPSGVQNFLATEKPEEKVTQLMDALKAPDLSGLKDIQNKSNKVSKILDKIMTAFSGSKTTDLSKYFLERKTTYTAIRVKALFLANSLSTGAEIHTDILEALLTMEVDESFYNSVVQALKDGAGELRERSKNVSTDLLVFKDSMVQSQARAEKTIESYAEAVKNLNKSKEDLAERLRKAKKDQEGNILSQIIGGIQKLFDSIGISVDLKGLFGGDPVGALSNEIRNVETEIASTQKASAQAKDALPFISEVIDVIQKQGVAWNDIALNMDSIASKYGIMLRGKVWLKIEGAKVIASWKRAKEQADQFIKDDQAGAQNALPEMEEVQKPYLEYLAARKFILDSVKDLLEFKVKFPDVEPDLQNLHQWLRESMDKYTKQAAHKNGNTPSKKAKGKKKVNATEVQPTKDDENEADNNEDDEDLVLDESCMEEEDVTVFSEETGRGLAVVSKLWKERELAVLFVEPEVSDEVAEAIAQLAAQWTEQTGIRFAFKKEGKAQIRITFMGKGFSSKVGTDATNDTRKPSMKLGFGGPENALITLRTDPETFRRHVLHEFGHAIGLKHEHMNPLGEIPWDEDKVYQKYRARGWNDVKIRQNMFSGPAIKPEVVNAALADKGMTELKDDNGVMWAFSAYDPASIMHYTVDVSLLRPGTEIRFVDVPRNTQLSVGDKLFAKLLYQPEELLG